MDKRIARTENPSVKELMRRHHKKHNDTNYSGVNSKNTQDIVEKRKIIHVDMDAFYASVEQRDQPEYQGQAVVVGGQPEKRGVVAACSYEARKYGIHSAMSSAKAYRLCPDAVFLKPRFSVYRQVSNEIRHIFHEFTDLIEPLSLDEAYLDVTGNMDFSGSATLMAKEIKWRIKQRLDLIASAGVSYNKFLAKIASDMDKPDGLYLITPEQGPDFIKTLPIRRFFGIGKATEAKMKSLGIQNGKDLQQKSLEELLYHFGKVGRFYFRIARAEDTRLVNNQRIRKSLGKETTFNEDLSSANDLLAVLADLSRQVADNLTEKGLVAKTVSLKVKYANFELISRSYTVDDFIKTSEQIFSIAKTLLTKTEVGQRKVRLLGISTSKLMDVSQSHGQAIEQYTLL